MRIEEAIQQKKPFRNPYQRALVNLIYTNNWMRDRMKDTLKPFGITMKQYNVMRILKGAGEPITTSVIRERLLDKMSDASRMVERLHQRGLVKRNTSPVDKRLVDVELSEEGKRVLKEMELVNGQIDSILKGLNEEEVQQLSELLDKIRG